jgi:hypothetical protein
MPSVYWPPCVGWSARVYAAIDASATRSLLGQRRRNGSRAILAAAVVESQTKGVRGLRGARLGAIRTPQVFVLETTRCLHRPDRICLGAPAFVSTFDSQGANAVLQRYPMVTTIAFNDINFCRQIKLHRRGDRCRGVSKHRRAVSLSGRERHIATHPQRALLSTHRLLIAREPPTPSPNQHYQYEVSHGCAPSTCFNASSNRFTATD